MTKILIIDPTQKSVIEGVYEFKHHGDVGMIAKMIIGENGLDHTSVALRGAIPNSLGTGMFVYEFGQLDPDPKWNDAFKIKGYEWCLVGRAIIYREDMNSLEQPLIDHGIDIDELKKNITWMRRIKPAPGLLQPATFEPVE